MPHNLHEPFLEVARELEALSDRAGERSRVPVFTTFLTFPVTEEMARDMGWVHEPLPPRPPEPRITRWKRRLFERYWAVRWRLAEMLAGQPLSEDEDY